MLIIVLQNCENKSGSRVFFQLTELVEVLVYAVGAERLNDGEDVVRSPGDDERQ